LLKLQSTPFIAVTSLSPSYMAQNVPLSTNIEAVLTEVGLGVLDGSEVLKLNGQTVNATITPTGTAPSRVISVKFAATLTAGTAYTAELDYKDVNGQSYSQIWPFNVPARHYVNALRFDAWLNIPGATTNDIDLTVLGNPPGSGPAGGGIVPDFQAIPITTFD